MDDEHVIWGGSKEQMFSQMDIGNYLLVIMLQVIELMASKNCVLYIGIYFWIFC